MGTGASLFGLMLVGGKQVGLEIDRISEVCVIKSLSPLMVSTPGVLGTITLRGDAIPVVDPGIVCGLYEQGAQPALAVVVALEGRRLALGVDEISGLTEVSEDDLQSFFDGAEDRPPLLCGGFTKDGATVNVIDPSKLFSQTSIPTARDTWHSERESLSTGLKPYLTFESGGARFAVEAIRVHATVPRQTIERNSLTSGACLGSIVHHGRRVPVLHSSEVIGLGSPEDLGVAEIVVIRFPDGRSVGFAVEVIRRISMLEEARQKPISPSLAGSTRFLRGTYSNRDGVQSYLFDIDAMHSDPELLNIAGLSDAAEQESETKARDPNVTDADGVIEERRRYLVVDAGLSLALPITQVVRILEPPEAVTPVTMPGAGLSGYCTIDGTATPLIDLGNLLGRQSADAAEVSRVVLAGPVGQRIGLIVRHVESIETSLWRKDEGAPHRITNGLVRLRAGDRTRVLEWVDLDVLAGVLCEPSQELTG